MEFHSILFFIATLSKSDHIAMKHATKKFVAKKHKESTIFEIFDQKNSKIDVKLYYVRVCGVSIWYKNVTFCWDKASAAWAENST